MEDRHRQQRRRRLVPPGKPEVAPLMMRRGWIRTILLAGLFSLLAACGFEWEAGDDAMGPDYPVRRLHPEDSLDLVAMARASGLQDPVWYLVDQVDAEGRVTTLSLNASRHPLVFPSNLRLPRLTSISFANADTVIWLASKRTLQHISGSQSNGLGTYQWLIDSITAVDTLAPNGSLRRDGDINVLIDRDRELELISRIRVRSMLYLHGSQLKKLPEWLYGTPSTLKVYLGGNYLCQVPDSTRRFLDERSPGWEEMQSCRICPDSTRIPRPESCP